MLPAPHVPHVAPWHLPLHSQAQGTQNFVLGAPSFLPEGFLRPPNSEEIRNQSIPPRKYPSPHSLKWSDSDALSLLLPEAPTGPHRAGPHGHSSNCAIVLQCFLFPALLPTFPTIAHKVTFQGHCLQLNPASGGAQTNICLKLSMFGTCFSPSAFPS